MKTGKYLKLKEELEITDKLLQERQKVIDLIPECPMHGGNCLPFCKEWIDFAKDILEKSDLITNIQRVKYGMKKKKHRKIVSK